MTVSKFIVVRGLVKAALSGLLGASLCYAVLFGGTNNGSIGLLAGLVGIGLLAGLVGVILQHYFQKDTDSPVNHETKGKEDES